MSSGTAEALAAPVSDVEMDSSRADRIEFRSSGTLIRRVSLGQLTSSAQALDAIVEVSKMVDDATLGRFVRELNRVLQIQARLCGHGIERGHDPLSGA